MFAAKPIKLKPKCTSHISERCSAKKAKNRLHLCVFIDKRYKWFYHPLKQKHVNPKKLQLIERATKARISKISVKDKFVSEKTVINWMLSIGIPIKTLSVKRYFIKNRVKSFANVLLIANQRRRELSLEPFFVKGVSDEY